MRKSTLYRHLAIVLIIISFVTLGGLGKAAMLERFYWAPFILNIVVYGAGYWSLIHAARKLEKEGK